MSEEVYAVVIATQEGMRDKFLAGWNHAVAMLANGDSVELRVGPSTLPITVEQRKFLHGVVLKQISEQVKVPTPNGKTERYTIDVWKEYFRARFLGWKWPMKRGFVKSKLTGEWRISKKATPHREPVSSETLGPAKYSKWTNEIIDHAVVEWGVEFIFENEERERVRYVHRPRRGREH